MARPTKIFFRRLRDAFLYSANFATHHFLIRRSFVNMREMRFIGLQRSGNHALINWIFNQSKEKKCLLNWVQADSNPFFSFHRKSTLREFQPDFTKKFSLNLEKSGIFSKKELLIYSYEDESLEKIATQNFEEKHDMWVGRSKIRQDILLMRDPFNLIASRLKRDDDKVENRYSFRDDSERKIIIGLWKQYAREFLGLSNHLLQDKICISYNKWFLDRDYREKIASRLGIEFSDSGMETVTGVGGGSSFDSIGYDKKASEMKVLERWRHYENDKDFRMLFADRELMDLSKAIFGTVPGLE